jgi:hypothetical protein
MKDLFDKIKKAEETPDMSGSRSRKEYQKKIRRFNIGCSLGLDLIIFLMILAVLGKFFGWW